MSNTGVKTSGNKIYAVFEGKRIIRMSKNKEELIRYIQSFPKDIRCRMYILEKEECHDE